MTDVDELRDRAAQLEKELNQVNAALGRLGESREILAPPGKSGYLFKWQDRSIGWGGTKWALRFISLDRGRISSYYNHLESAPRYMLSLRGCAVRDEGWKRNRRHKTKGKKVPPFDEVGAYFFVFSIYHRQDSSASPGEAADIVPLLRFSTPSLAEKSQWIQLVSEACAYCETDSFLKEEATRNFEEEFRRQQQINMAEAMPQAERGTLPPLYFATKTQPSLKRRPSLSKRPKSTLFRTKSTNRDAEKSEKKGYPPSKPMHRSSAPSFLSPEAKSQNYRGFLNLGMIILIFSNFRLVLNSGKCFLLSAVVLYWAAPLVPFVAHIISLLRLEIISSTLWLCLVGHSRLVPVLDWDVGTISISDGHPSAPVFLSCSLCH
jgi:hypothetical protein